MLEKVIEDHLVKSVKQAGGTAYKFTSPARRSVPDRLVIFPGGRIYLVELKKPSEEPTPAQLREHKRLRFLGCDVRVIDTKMGVDKFLQEVA